MCNNGTQAATPKLGYELLDASGRCVASGSERATVAPGQCAVLRFAKTLADVATWSSEAPNLYRVLLTLKEGDRTTEVDRKSTRLNSSHWS